MISLFQSAFRQAIRPMPVSVPTRSLSGFRVSLVGGLRTTNMSGCFSDPVGAKRNHRYKKSKWGPHGPGPYLRRNRPSIHQLAKPMPKPYRNKWRRGKIWLSGAFKGAPHKKGVVTKVYIKNPKKPNSANRKVCNVTLSNKEKIRCVIPGIGHNLFEHSSVLIRGGRCRDLIGFHYKVVRGKYDCKPVIGRKSSRSKYGVKKPK
ncbi:hypothetical protein NDN08_002428 [Rhodosorus marinus]|uniref:Ribosomal protein S12 n=1 Tax=Rhodosorus marinus TaxID=101924 RepID=A0AAV8UX93_9RHOD|nr:hypothetical protein NDN08_002428 [Rhodosorus marinus]